MERSLLKIEWNNIESYSDEDISYFLFLEGKGIETISKIRNLSRETVETHIINGKIRFGMLARSRDIKELFRRICSAGKPDKINALSSLEESNRKELFQFINSSYKSMSSREKEVALWIIGECSAELLSPILTEALISNEVNIRRMAISAMGKLADSSFEDALISCLEDCNPQVVLYAVKALTKLKSKKCFEKVKSICEESNKDYLKRAYTALLNEVDT